MRARHQGSSQPRYAIIPPQITRHIDTGWPESRALLSKNKTNSPHQALTRHPTRKQEQFALDRNPRRTLLHLFCHRVPTGLHPHRPRLRTPPSCTAKIQFSRKAPGRTYNRHPPRYTPQVPVVRPAHQQWCMRRTHSVKRSIAQAVTSVPGPGACSVHALTQARPAYAPEKRRSSDWPTNNGARAA